MPACERFLELKQLGTGVHVTVLQVFLVKLSRTKAQLLLVSGFCGEDLISSIQEHVALVNGSDFY